MILVLFLVLALQMSMIACQVRTDEAVDLFHEEIGGWIYELIHFFNHGIKEIA